MNNHKIISEEKQATYHMMQIKGVGLQSGLALISYAGTAKEALALPERDVRGILPQRSADAFIKGREAADRESVECLERKHEFRFIPYVSSDYPDKLRNISDPPLALFVKGKLPDPECPSVAIVGARACSEYGKLVARQFGKQLGAMGIQIVSGMAKGIDGIAQQGALDGGGETYAVLGSGIDIVYPPENESIYYRAMNNGGVISEYPPGTEAYSKLFPQRNRIISGLADLLLVVEARKRSGTYITVSRALEQGKDVFVVPGRITDNLSEGCNYLLTQGAGIAISPQIIANELSRNYFYKIKGNVAEQVDVLPKKEKVERWQDSGINNHVPTKSNGNAGKDTVLRNTILSALDVTPIELQILYQRLQDKITVSVEELLLELTRMQMDGIVSSVGNYYQRTYPL